MCRFIFFRLFALRLFFMYKIVTRAPPVAQPAVQCSLAHSLFCYINCYPRPPCTSYSNLKLKCVFVVCSFFFFFYPALSALSRIVSYVDEGAAYPK